MEVVDVQELARRVGERYSDVVVARGEVTVTVGRDEALDALRWLKDQPDLSFGFVADVSCTDWPGRDPRIWMAYHLLSMKHHHRLRVKAGLPPEDLRIASITPEFPAADWQEREVFDLFGVTFEGHPDLRRVLMPEGWQGHPLRKDEPMGGVPTMFKGARLDPPDERGL